MDVKIRAEFEYDNGITVSFEGVIGQGAEAKRVARGLFKEFSGIIKGYSKTTRAHNYKKDSDLQRLQRENAMQRLQRENARLRNTIDNMTAAALHKEADRRKEVHVMVNNGAFRVGETIEIQCRPKASDIAIDEIDYLFGSKGYLVKIHTDHTQFMSHEQARQFALNECKRSGYVGAVYKLVGLVTTQTNYKGVALANEWQDP